MTERVKFSTQAAPDLLAAMRATAKREGRQFQAVLEDAMRLYIEHRHGQHPRSHVMEHLQASTRRNHALFRQQTG